MRLEVLVGPQGVERCGVKACQEHVDHDHQIQLAFFQPLRQVLVVVLELVGAGVEAGAEQSVVVLDCGFQKIAGAGIQPLGFKLLFAQDAIGFFLVGGKAVYQADLEPLRLGYRLFLLGELRVVAFGGIDGGAGEQRVEACEALAVVTVAAGARSRVATDRDTVLAIHRPV